MTPTPATKPSDAVWSEVRQYWRDASAELRHETLGAKRWVELAVVPRLPPLGETVLEWGYGGGFLQQLAGTGVHRWYAVDVADGPLRRARARGVRAVPAWEIEQVPDGVADAVLSIATFQHFPSHSAALWTLGQMRRIAKPGSHGLIHVRPTSSGESASIDEGAGPYCRRAIRSQRWDFGTAFRSLERSGFRVVYLERNRGLWIRFRG